MNNQTTLHLNDSDIASIFNDFDSGRLSQLFAGNALEGMHEFLVDIFQSEDWMGQRNYDRRNTFLLSIEKHNPTPDQQRTLFRAMAESGNTHAVAKYLHMLGTKHKVRLSDRTALLSSSDLHAMVSQIGLGLANNIHYLARAMLPDNPRSVRAIWQSMHKLHDPEHQHAGLWLSAMQTLVNRFGLQATGLGASNVDNDPWIKLFFNSRDKRSVQIAGSVLASQISRHLLSKESLIERAVGLGDEMRLIKTFKIAPEVFKYQSVHSSHSHRAPDYLL